MPTVYYTCSSVPPELIAACGCTPCRLIPASQTGNGSPTQGVCPFAQAWLDALLNLKAPADALAVFTTACDQMRRTFDLYSQRSMRPAFLLNVPATGTPHAFAYYRQELERLKTCLCALSGQAYDESRLQTMMAQDDEPAAAASAAGCLKIAITGGPLPAALRQALYGLLEKGRAACLCDAAEDRLPRLFRQFNPAQQAPFTRLAEAYFQLPAIGKRPNDDFYHLLQDRIAKQHIDGLLLLRYVGCDLWHSSLYELKQRLAVPVLAIDLDGGPAFSASAVSRLQAFLETLAS